MQHIREARGACIASLAELDLAFYGSVWVFVCVGFCANCGDPRDERERDGGPSAGLREEGASATRRAGAMKKQWNC